MKKNLVVPVLKSGAGGGGHFVATLFNSVKISGWLAGDDAMGIATNQPSVCCPGVWLLSQVVG